MQKSKTVDKLKGFVRHGIQFNGETNTQAYGDCPFSGKADKFYVNKENLCWDSKITGQKGNFLTFLELISEENKKAMSGRDLRKLAANRGLPAEAFKPWGLGINGNMYTLPIFNEKGTLQDLRTYRLGRRIMSTPGCSTGLLGMERLIDTQEKTIYLCEGEWDCIAFSWWLKKIEKPGLVVGVPGASTFKTDWAPLFKDKNVVVLYDNDAAGEQGETTVASRLSGCVRSIQFLHWTTKFPKGFDIRDLAVEAVKQKSLRKTFRALNKMLKPVARRKPPEELVHNEVLPADINWKTTWDDVERVFNKWMKIASFDPIKVAIATLLSNEMEGDPCWIFLVAPPGGSKTEILSSLFNCVNVYATSTLTSQALISGSILKSGKEPSLLPRLDGKTLICKDFTVVLGKKEAERTELFSILRDAYDGHAGKVFGNGLEKYFKSRFTMLAGVTPTIYEITSQMTGLGERFLKLFIGDNLEHGSEKEIILKAMRNVNREVSMREEISKVVRDYVEVCKKRMRERKTIPHMSPDSETQVVAMAQFAARMRATISREKHNSEMILAKPSAEVGSRLGKQITRLGYALTNGALQDEISTDQLRIMRKVVLDTVPQRAEDILRTVYKMCPTKDDTVKTKQVAFQTKYTASTVKRVLDDMVLLGIINRVGVGNANEWTISDYMRDLIDDAKLYRTVEELNRPAHCQVIQRKKKVKVVVKKKKKTKTSKRT